MIIIGVLEYHFEDAVKAAKAYTELKRLEIPSPTTAHQLRAQIRRKYKREYKYIEKHCKDMDLSGFDDIEGYIMSLP